MSSRPPTHILKVMQREGKGKGRIGVGWLNDDGSMSLSLDPCVVLSWKDDVVINAFPVEFKEKG